MTNQSGYSHSMFINRFRKIIIIGIAFSFAATILPAVSAQIAGSKCVKLGTTKTVSNIKYTCIKQGSKLIWNKGVAIKKPAVKPTPASSPSPIPTPTQTSSASATSSPTPTPTPSKPPEISISQRWDSIDQTALKVFSEANKIPLPNTHQNVFIWQTSAKANSEAVAEIKQRYESAGRWWANFAKSANPVKVLIANYNEAEWICQIKLAWLDNMTQPDCVAIESNGQSSIPTAGQSQRGSKQVDMYQVDSRATMDTIFFYGRIEHEFTHNIFYAQSPMYQEKIPCWMTEGGAELFGNLSAFGSDPNMYIQVRNFKAHRDELKNQTVADWLNYINRADVSDNFPEEGDRCGAVRHELYNHGTLPNEYLVSKLGVLGYLNLIKEASNTSWPQAIQKTIGKTKNELYADMAQYMKTQYDLIEANPWSVGNLKRVAPGR